MDANSATKQVRESAEKVAATEEPSTLSPRPRIGTAGWALPHVVADRFCGDGTHLQRYARMFRAAEINSSFRRAHRRQTYAKWAASVPDDFRFSVKLPKEITHVRRLIGTQTLLDDFLDDVEGLDLRLGCLLVQLPPSLAWAAADVEAFFGTLRERYAGDVAVEPRHASWFDDDCEGLLQSYRLSRVAADPGCVPAARIPGGWKGCRYWRLHGSPRVYYSAYSDVHLDRIAAAINAAAHRGTTPWCIFDNTALGAATSNALALESRFCPPAASSGLCAGAIDRSSLCHPAEALP